VYCHKRNIVHRDLKPENLLLVSNDEIDNIKVIDFGTSVVFDPNTKMRHKFGTPYYIAPEVLNRMYDEKCDVWSCGVIMYILLCGQPPFKGKTHREIFDKIRAGKFTFQQPEWGYVSREAMKLIKKMLTYNATDRPSAEEALNDEWIYQ
jgi:calcium-dependent protein kinase